MTRTVEQTVSEIQGMEYGMDTPAGDEEVGKIVAEAYRLFPTDFMRALDTMEEGRSKLALNCLHSEVRDSEVGDRMTATLRMFVRTPEQDALLREVVEQAFSKKPEAETEYSPVQSGIIINMPLTEMEWKLLESFIGADMDNEHDKGADEGLRMEFDMNLHAQLKELEGTSDMVLVMVPGEYEVAAMLVGNWHLSGDAGETFFGMYQDNTEWQDEFRNRTDEECLTLMHEAIEALYKRFFPGAPQVISI